MSETGSAGTAGPTPDFPFQWPDPTDATLHWTQSAADGRLPEAMRPLELDVRARFARTLRHSADICGWPNRPRTIELNGWQYWCYEDGTPDSPSLLQRRMLLQQTGDRLYERGENYLQAITFPEMRAGNRRLVEADPDALSDQDMAKHLSAALEWYERGWTLHWTRPRNDPGRRFGALYQELSGEQETSRARELLSDEPNKMSEAVEGLVALAGTVQQEPALRELFDRHAPEEVLAALDGVPGGPAFRERLDGFLDPDQQGLRSGASWGVEQTQVLPAWRDHPQLVVAMVQKYVPLDLSTIGTARAEAIARRDQRVARLRDTIEDEGRRQDFDRALAAGRRATQAQDDHNYYIDSAVGGLLHRGISACGRRLAGAGVLAGAEDVWWLREAQVLAALRGLAAGQEGRQDGRAAGEAAGRAPERPIDWRRLVAAQQALFAWQRSLRPPPTLGAPAPQRQRPASTPAEPQVPAPEPDPAGLLLKGQTGAPGRRVGRVRRVGYQEVVPDVRPGDVLVAHTAGALWSPLAPALAGVVLEVGGAFQHIMIVCREFGVPGVVNASGAGERLRDGDQVVVDGTRGMVLAP